MVSAKPDGLADDSVGRRRFSPNLIAGGILAVLAIAVFLWQQPWKTGPTSDKPSIATNAGTKIAGQIHLLADARTEEKFLAAAGDSKAARNWAKETFANITLLGATDIRMRFIRGGLTDVRADGATEATVEVSWRPGPQSGLTEKQTSRSDVTFVLDQVKGQSFAIRAAERGDGALPLWLAGKLDLTRGSGATIISVDGGDTTKPIGDYAGKAHKSVSSVVSSAKSQLAVVSPRTQAQTAALLDQSVDSIAQIAAVTTTIDGSGSAKVATVVVLNPDVFATMDARAAQVVMTHEAAHVMTHAATSASETWVAEGFADFVALHDDRAPLSVSAGQILRNVRKDGAPKRLPTAEDFGSTQHGLGGTYESAWMIFRMLGERFGDDALVRFYNDVLSGTPTGTASESAFGLSIADITRDWRDYLAKSASITS